MSTATQLAVMNPSSETSEKWNPLSIFTDVFDMQNNPYFDKDKRIYLLGRRFFFGGIIFMYIHAFAAQHIV